MRLENIGLTRIVWMVAGIGMVLAMLFALSDVWRNFNSASEMRRNADLVDLSIALSDMVHEQQKERGASSVFLSSKGRTFRSEMRSQRLVLDEKTVAAKEQLEAVRNSGINGSLESKLDDLSQRMAEVETMRSQVDALAVGPEQAVDFYTNFNRSTIGLVGEIASGVTDPEVARKLLVYSAFLFGKDYAGLDRSNGASGYAVGQFDQAATQKLIKFPAVRQGYLDYVSTNADPDHKAQLERIMSSAKAKQLASLRTIALSGDADRIAAVSASNWFDVSTAMLGDFKALEVTMAQSISDKIANALSAANSGLIIALALLLCGVALAGGLCFMFVRVIRARLASVVEPLQLLSVGTHDVVIPDHGQNEFGVISKAMGTFRQGLLDRAESAAQREQVVRVLGARLKAMAKGDLEQSIDDFFSEDLKSIRMDFNEAQSSLREVIQSVITSAREIDHSAGDVNSAATDLSERTARQAATLEETAAALQRTNKGIQSSAELAQSTNAEVARTRESATQNGKIVTSAMEAMEQIQASFNEVEKITKMIQDIAFQTNILALNAGVEATRAGEAGKGFGVVATEVRALAQRSSEAVTSIQQLMSTSGEKISHGSEQVAASGSALKDMIDRIDRVSEQVEELALASGVQAQGLNEIDSALSELERDTQQNAAMAEQSSAASGLLNREVTKLNQRTAVFVRSGQTTNYSPSAGDEGSAFDLRMAS